MEHLEVEGYNKTLIELGKFGNNIQLIVSKSHVIINKEIAQYIVDVLNKNFQLIYNPYVLNKLEEKEYKKLMYQLEHINGVRDEYSNH